MKWLGQPCDRLDGKVPIEMLDTDDQAEELMRYMANWAADQQS